VDEDNTQRIRVNQHDCGTRFKRLITGESICPVVFGGYRLSDDLTLCVPRIISGAGSGSRTRLTSLGRLE
jgi:hypothetical protein